MGNHHGFQFHNSDDSKIRVLELFPSGEAQGIFQSMSEGGFEMHI